TPVQYNNYLLGVPQKGYYKELLSSNEERFGGHTTGLKIYKTEKIHKIVSNGEGSALLKNIPLISDIVSSVVKAISPIPVTVKTRLGWDKNSINVVDVAKAIEQSGASAICVHARTKDQLYSPGVSIEYIKTVKENISIPVIGNGDIFTAEDAINMFNKTGCDAIAVARGALGNPWIFDEIKAKIKGEMFIPPSTKERCEEALKQLKYSIEDKGEYTAIVESRKYISHYTKGIQGSSKIRQALNSANSIEEIQKLLEKLSGSKLV
ncbi:MAG: tRNA-dihydrouridine synthase, partial [Clostridia bacterium]|nr:tRNA-dihydrouridine synthase [Clostridia bacterium]